MKPGVARPGKCLWAMTGGDGRTAVGHSTGPCSGILPLSRMSAVFTNGQWRRQDFVTGGK